MSNRDVALAYLLDAMKYTLRDDPSAALRSIEHAAAKLRRQEEDQTGS